jgi:hypothetical protein
MMTNTGASEYICVKDARHKQVSMSCQKLICWQCGSKMKEIRHGVITKGKK